VNERIIEFRKQCITEVKDQHGNWINYHFDENKFAELIVQECSDWLKQPVNQTPSCGVTMNLAADRLKEHFGVE